MSSRHRLLLLALLAGATLLRPGTSRAEDAGARTFADPAAAVHALVQAAQAHDVDALVAIVGPAHAALVRTGDDAADRAERERFAGAAGEAVRLETVGDDRVIVHVGYADWAFPLPLVRHGDAWSFDAAAGAQEVRDRRVGANELAAITFCEAVQVAQALYLREDHDGDGVHEYARRLVSSPGRHDGLYWHAGPGEPASPLGQVLGLSGPDALGAGPGARWMGYAFRLLGGQGPCAPGGAYGYVIRGNMVAGFALLATPLRYGDTGIATFAMGPNGVVLQRDYGPGTAMCAGRVCVFSPDASWTAVDG